MLPAIQAIWPICALVALGCAMATCRAFPRRLADALSAMVARIGLPVLVFQAVVCSDFSRISPWTLWACYFPAAALSWGLGHLALLKWLGRDEKLSVIGGVGSAFANTAFVGLPLARAVYGEHGVLIVTTLISVHMPLMMTAATLLMRRAEEKRSGAISATRIVGRILGNLVTNPIVLALAGAALLRASGIVMPGAAQAALARIAEAAGPLALFALGLGLRRKEGAGETKSAAVVTFVKLVVMPALTLVACRLAHLAPGEAGPLVMLAGVPAGINVHLVAVQFRVGQALGARIVVLTTAASALTSTVWLACLRAF